MTYRLVLFKFIVEVIFKVLSMSSTTPPVILCKGWSERSYFSRVGFLPPSPKHAFVYANGRSVFPGPHINAVIKT